MISWDLKHKVDPVRDAVWIGGISKTRYATEQITYPLFRCGLEDFQTLKQADRRRGRRPCAYRSS
jgi:hypothetical protein